jgi:hypothetical protein
MQLTQSLLGVPLRPISASGVAARAENQTVIPDAEEPPFGGNGSDVIWLHEHTGHGGMGAVLRREGIYSSTLHGWRKETC